MNPPGLVETTTTPVVPPRTQLQLFMDDTLASSRRLWLRGRILGDESLLPGEPTRRWWQRRGHAVEAPPTLHITTRVTGLELKAEAILQPDGRFEVLHDVQLPPARRGWRVARNRIDCNGQQAERCNVVLTTPADATCAHVVLLPLVYTQAAGGLPPLAQPGVVDADLELLSRTLRGLGSRPVYYLAGCPENLSPEKTEGYLAELALAIASHGWPTGSILLAPAAAEETPAAMLRIIDRLRWLFAGSLELEVLNTEPLLADAMNRLLEASDDHATVTRLIEPEAGADMRRAAPPSFLLRSRRRASRSTSLPKHPIVFCHGMLAYSMLRFRRRHAEINSFTPLREFLRQRGFQALFPEVEPTGGVASRAAELKEQILRWTDEPVNLIAHSMGGLDARHLISRLDMADRVRSLTTVSTPHRGTFLADWFMINYRQRVPLLRAFEAAGFNVDGFRDCTREACRAFNEVTPNRDEVRYFSYGGDVSQAYVTPPLRRAWNILTPVEGPNDGMVSLNSAHWGEYLGTIRADHFAQLPDKVATRPNEDFDVLGFYIKLVEDLARRGF